MSIQKQAGIKEWENRYKFLIVVEKAGDNYSAYVPDLPGCIATGKTKEEVEEHMIKAIKFHIQGLLEDGL